MKTWDTFYSFVRPHVQGCPLSYVDAALKASARELCERSHIWWQETICGDLIAGEQTYSYNYNTDGLSIVTPIKVIIREIIPGSDPDADPRIVDHHIKNVNLQDLDRYNPNWRQATSEWPKHFYMKNANTFTFVERPTEDKWGTVHALCAVKPSQDALGVADFLYEEWAETIAAGALKRLLAMSSRTWANVQMVSYYERQFRDGVSRAREKVMKSYTIQTKQMVLRPFA